MTSSTSATRASSDVGPQNAVPTLIDERDMPKITPFLWFDDNLEEALSFYSSVFKAARITDVTRTGSGGRGTTGNVTSATFELEGQEFMALNGGPHFRFTEAVSFFVRCESQSEVDELWAKLSEGGTEGRCGWLKDRFGLSWQIIPTALGAMLGDPDRDRSQRVMQAMLRMQKIDIEGLRHAYEHTA